MRSAFDSIDAARVIVDQLTRDDLPLVQPGVVQLLPPDFSDDRLALDFVENFGHAYRWSPGLGWMHDAGVTWRRDDALTRYDMTRRICREAATRAEAGAEKKRLTSAKTVSAVLSLAQSDKRLVTCS